MANPATEAELSEAIRAAGGPLRIVGGGTRPVGAGPGEVLSTTGLRGISLYEPGALTVVAAAGTPLAEVEAALAAENQRLPFEPMDHRALLGSDGVPTVGGMVAANASGPRRIQSGACRDSLIGVRFVDGAGVVIKNGGRVMKNVTGYDLVKLLAGSWGTLGVLSEVAFKVLPGVAATASLTLRGLAPGQAVAAMSAALGSPYEVSGAAHLPRAEGGPATLLRIEGFAASVAYRAGRLGALLASFGALEVEEDPEVVGSVWRGVRDVTDFAGTGTDIWRVSVKPSDGPDVVSRLGDARWMMDWGGGLIWVETATGTDLRAALSGIAGHATLIRAAPATHAALGTFHPEPAPLAAITQGLRDRFDPRGVFNTGLMAPAAQPATV